MNTNNFCVGAKWTGFRVGHNFLIKLSIWLNNRYKHRMFIMLLVTKHSRKKELKIVIKWIKHFLLLNCETELYPSFSETGFTLTQGFRGGTTAALGLTNKVQQTPGKKLNPRNF